MRDRSTMNGAASFNTGAHQGLRQGARAQDRCDSAACMLDSRQVSPERARIAFQSEETIGVSNEIIRVSRVCNIGRRTDIGVFLAGTSRFGMPRNGIAVGLGRQFNGLFRHRIRRDLPVSNQAGRRSQDLEHFAEAGAWDVETAEHIHVPIYGEAGIQGDRCHGDYRHRQRSDDIRHFIHHCDRNNPIEPIPHSQRPAIPRGPLDV